MERNNHKWEFREGFLIGGCLLAAGLALQYILGPVDWRWLAAPVNKIVLALLTGLIAVIFLLRKKVQAFEWMMHSYAAVSSLACALALTLVMGLTTQKPSGGLEWLSQMIRFWPFVLVWTWVLIVDGLAALNHFLRMRASEIPFILNHLGVFVAIVAATLGSADMQQLQMQVHYGKPENRALSEYGEVVDPGLAIELHEFTAEYYPDNTPKLFASEITIHTRDDSHLRGTVLVNKPMKADGWKIYQAGYDQAKGSESPYSIFLLVKDPWLPAVYAGIFMMIAGALCLMLFMAPKPIRKEDEQ